MTSKNALGSMPRAEEKSVPVFLRECIAARIACTAATQETKEKTEDHGKYEKKPPIANQLTDDFRTHIFRFLAREGRRETARDNIDNDL